VFIKIARHNSLSPIFFQCRNSIHKTLLLIFPTSIMAMIDLNLPAYLHFRRPGTRTLPGQNRRTICGWSPPGFQGTGRNS
jgi:hypothetical protein